MNFFDQWKTSKHNANRGLKSVTVYYHESESLDDERYVGITPADIKLTIRHMRNTIPFSKVYQMPEMCVRPSKTKELSADPSFNYNYINKLRKL